MAEVTGYLGDQPIELNNAATEATMKQLVAAIALMSAKMGADKKTQAQQSKELDKFFKQLGTTSDKMKKLNDQVDDAVTLEKKANAARKEQIESYKKLSANLDTAVNKLATVMNAFASMGSSISGAVSAMGTVNKNLGTLFAGVAASTEKYMTVFKQSASVGAGFNGSIREMANAISSTGLTFDQFSAIVAKNGENLALFGGSTQQGAKQLAAYTKTLRSSFKDLDNDLARLGYSTDDISNSMATYMGMVGRSGRAQQMNDQDLIKSTGQYLKNLDAVSKITGKTKDELMSQRKARETDADFQALQYQLDAKSYTNLEALMDAVPDKLQNAVKTAFLRGTIDAKDPTQVYAMSQMGPLMNKVIAEGQKAQATGQFSAGTGDEIYRDLTQQTKNLADIYKDPNGGGVLKSLQYQEGATEFRSGVFAGAVRKGTTVGEEIELQRKALEEAAKGDDTAAKSQKFQQQIADDSNKLMKAQVEELGKVVTAYKLVATQLPLVTSLYQVMMANIGLVIGSLVVFNAALWAASNMPGGGSMGGRGSRGGRGGRGGGSGRFGKIGKFIGKNAGKFSVGGILGGLALDYGAEKATESGHDKLGASLDVGSSMATGAGLGAMAGLVGGPLAPITSGIGAGIGAVLGLGYGLISNWTRLTKAEIAAKQNTVASEKELAKTVEEINRDRVAAEKSIDLNDPIALLLNEIKTTAPRVFEAFLRGNGNGGVVSSGGGGYSGATGSNFIKQQEGADLNARYDAAGRHSIGYGHNITANEIQRGHITLGDGSKIKLASDYRQTSITQEQADALFESDKGQYYGAAKKGIGAEAWSKLNDNQKTALASYAYNTGGTADLAKKGLTDAIMSGDMSRASAIIAGGKNTSDGKVVSGLTARRGRESELFVSQTSSASAQVKSNPSNSSVGNPELDSIVADKQQKEENQKNIDKRYNLNTPIAAQDAAQKSAESNAGGVNNTADNMSMMVTILKEQNTILKEQNTLIKKGTWMP